MNALWRAALAASMMLALAGPGAVAADRLHLRGLPAAAIFDYVPRTAAGARHYLGQPAKGAGGQRWFPVYPSRQLEPGDPLHWTGRDHTWNYQSDREERKL